MRAAAVRGTNFRCYSHLELELEGGVVAAVGPNGAGKTALVEMIHFSALGYSPRTSADPQLITLGADFLRTDPPFKAESSECVVRFGAVQDPP